MKIDFHSHVKISKKSSFMPKYFQEMMQEAKESGLDALAMTEHFNTDRFYDIYDYLADNYTYENNYYLVDGLKLFPGIEVDVKEIGHILLIGDREDIIAIRSSLDHHIGKDQFIPFAELLDLADRFNVLKIGAHAFRESTPLHHHDYEQLKRLDALDLNGKDLYTYGVNPYYDKLTSFANQLGLPIVAGSDTHQFFQYGSVYNTFETACDTIDQLKNNIEQNQYKIEISPSLDVKVKSAIFVKKILKSLLNKDGVIEMGV
ncbi:PHP domain-containing protein [Amphibacillus sp. MSJ-3]|uniref:PHP domain-containing protein n=1 Tax=Amphibacillus sp. MSJ-3 TaxID=2841505 RepID=UPI001C0EF29A|nr:PHP-associated domain-containing protein [Amphibacillus sp. MSJ-3]MBU5593810.1 PHP domain-containing protein [Amphibacillus sp. MSJ-3]